MGFTKRSTDVLLCGANNVTTQHNYFPIMCMFTLVYKNMPSALLKHVQDVRTGQHTGQHTRGSTRGGTRPQRMGLC